MPMTTRSALRALAAVSLAASAVFASACIMPTEAQGLRRDLTEVRLEIQDLKAQNGELKRRLDYSLTQIDQKLALQKDTLGAATRDIQDQLTRIENRLGGSVSAGAAAGLAPKAGGDTPPDLSGAQSEALLAGHEAYSRGEYDEAIKQYSKFLQQYPNSDKAPEAAFCLSRSWYQKSDFEKARQGFERIAQQYPGNEIVPKAMHSKALCEIRGGKLNDAAATLRTLMQQYPDYETDKVKALFDGVQSGAILQP